MTRKRKTTAQRRQENREAERRAWETFRAKLAAVQSFNDVLKLYNEAVAPDTPGRKYYSNLGFFLQTFAPPNGANVMELWEYLRLITLFDAEGVLQEGACTVIEQSLQSAIRRGINY